MSGHAPFKFLLLCLATPLNNFCDDSDSRKYMSLHKTAKLYITTCTNITIFEPVEFVSI